MKTKLSTGFGVVFCILTLVSSVAVMAADERRLLNLRGDWKFKLGDNKGWADPKFDDHRWSEIYVPAQWEDEGYPGYDGYAWYRKHFEASEGWRSNDLLLELGMIDDVDEVYVNGQLVGCTGSFPPDYSTAYNIERRYAIGFDLLKPDEDNVISVRVYDDHGVGGITDGPVGLYQLSYSYERDFSLPATWKFKTGDNPDWKEETYDDKDWKHVQVPAYWETQGFRDYDGYAWYRVTFNVPKEYRDENLIVLLGKIDDFDEVYLNGERIGKTGPMPTYKMTRPDGDEYDQERAYTVPSGLIHFDGENVLAVRVYDCWQGGGIYEGPIGIVTRDHYRYSRRSFRHVETWFENLIDDIFRR